MTVYTNVKIIKEVINKITIRVLNYMSFLFPYNQDIAICHLCFIILKNYYINFNDLGTLSKLFKICLISFSLQTYNFRSFISNCYNLMLRKII